MFININSSSINQSAIYLNAFVATLIMLGNIVSVKMYRFSKETSQILCKP